MEQQVIITVGREFGSGGLEIAKHLAEHYGLKLYDKNLLYEILDAKKITNIEDAQKFDEVPKSFVLSRKVRGYSSSPEENIAHMQFEFLAEQADKGESFVVVGRCADEVLRGRKQVISIFILGDYADRLEYVKEYFKVSADEAEDFMKYHTKRRKGYHNYYSSTKWGDSRGYDLCVNSSCLGHEGTCELLIQYIDKRLEEMKNA